MPQIAVGNRNAYGVGAPAFRLRSLDSEDDLTTLLNPLMPENLNRIPSREDVVAGMFLFVYGFIGIAFYTIVTLSMIRMSKDIVGFRFLISQSISDVLLLIQFAIWPGLLILSQNEVIPVEWRWHVHLYLDFTWWAMASFEFD